MITKILLISLFCCGLRKLTDEGMLLHPFKVWLNRVVKGPEFTIADFIGNRPLADEEKIRANELGEEWHRKYENKREWLLMPVINCIYCYPSFWGSIVYWLLTLFVFPAAVNIQTLVAWPICCIAAVFTNGLLYSLFQKNEPYMQ